MPFNFVNKFYISDTHFGHEAVLGFCNRPFTSIAEHDAEIIDRWNSVVRDDDIIYHLGDFCFGPASYAEHIFHQLRGRKILILGNHDMAKGRALPHIETLPWDRPPVSVLETTDEGDRVFLSHYAHRVWPSSHRGSYHFYGHSHGNLMPIGRSRDVGVDLEDVFFTPRTFNELTRGMAIP